MPENWDRANLYEGALIGYAVGSSAATEDKDKADLLIELAEMQKKVGSLGEENDKLREQVEYWHNAATTAIGTTAELRRVRAEWKKDRDDNAGLRKLIHGLYWCTEDGSPGRCEECPLGDSSDPLTPTCKEMMAELGVEV